MSIPVVLPDSDNPDSSTDGAAFVGVDESKQRRKILSMKSADDDEDDDDDDDDVDGDEANNGTDVDIEEQQPILF